MNETKAVSGHTAGPRIPDGLAYRIEFSHDSGCFVAVPNIESADAWTLPGETWADAYEFAKRTGLRLRP